MATGAADVRYWYGRKRGSSRSTFATDIRDVPIFIYGLTGPDDVVRYIGKSSYPRGRLKSHAGDAGALAVRKWMASLRADGHEVQIVILHEVAPGLDASPAERWFIEVYERCGSILNTRGTPRRGHCRFCESPEHHGDLERRRCRVPGNARGQA